MRISQRLSRFLPHQWLAVVLTGTSLGMAARFWYAVYAPTPPLTLDWTPLVYWVIGIAFAAIAVHHLRSTREFHPKANFIWMLVINLTVFAGYLVPPALIVFRAFSLLNS